MRTACCKKMIDLFQDGDVVPSGDEVVLLLDATPGTTRQVIIQHCPFCGKKLIPQGTPSAEGQTAMEQLT